MGLLAKNACDDTIMLSSPLLTEAWGIPWGSGEYIVIVDRLGSLFLNIWGKSVLFVFKSKYMNFNIDYSKKLWRSY